ncbi:hypothetical protein ACQ9BO_20170 [Flavobacterium sp. P21]
MDDLDENAMLSNILKQKKATPKVVPLYKKWAFRAYRNICFSLGSYICI